jgi:hypothetical protein
MDANVFGNVIAYSNVGFPSRNRSSFFTDASVAVEEEKEENGIARAWWDRPETIDHVAHDGRDGG